MKMVDLTCEAIDEFNNDINFNSFVYCVEILPISIKKQR